MPAKRKITTRGLAEALICPKKRFKSALMIRFYDISDRHRLPWRFHARLLRWS